MPLRLGSGRCRVPSGMTMSVIKRSDVAISTNWNLTIPGVFSYTVYINGSPASNSTPIQVGGLGQGDRYQQWAR